MENGNVSSTPTRRVLLRLAAGGSIAGLAGCINMPSSANRGGEEPPADFCLDDLEDSVPESERTAPSIDGIESQPESELTPKDEAGYTCGPVDGQLCGTCTFYIDDKDGDAIGACTEVAGEIRSVDWCGLWQPREKVREEGGDVEAVEIEPDTRIEFDGQTDGWVGMAPESIEGATNPTLVLQEGETYEIGWSQGDGAPHNIAIWDDNDEIVDGLQTEIVEEPGDDQWLEFEASSEMTTYICEVHPTTMIGGIEIA